VLRVEAETRIGPLELDVALEVPEGSCLALAGPSGAGKTSVLRIAAGLVRPERGVVACGDEVWLDTARGIEEPPERRRCGYVFQDYALFGHMSAWRNVAYAGVDRSRALALLDRFGLADRADAKPAQLSGGERQRVAVARALAREPDVLLLDEPLSALDARTRAAATRELADVLRSTGAPALLVTHDFQEAAQLGDRVGVLDHGRVVQLGDPAELAARPASAFVADFTGAVVLTGVASPGADGVTLVELDGGGTVTSTDAAAGPVAAAVYPWEIVLEPGRAPGSAQNHIAAEVVSVTAFGGRARIALAAGQPLVAEVTTAAVHELALAPGVRVTASWKAAATRLTPR
jgi:molybdate transport system ATP-binding protein